MGKWTLVRHARTPWNIEGRVQGHSGAPLGAAGCAEAQRLAARLKASRFEAAYSSDLDRAVETAETVLAGRGTSLDKVPQLRELAYGEWEGLVHSEVEARYPESYAEMVKASIDFSPPGGESPRDVLRRVAHLTERVREGRGTQEDLLVVGHSGSLKALAVVLLGLLPESYWRFRLAPASLSVITVYDDWTTLDLWNDTTHLEGLDA